jgi:hypothetical protein
MANYFMTCTCGHQMHLEASGRPEAVRKFKEMMTQEALDQHMRERHQPNEPKPSLQEAHDQIALRVSAISQVQGTKHVALPNRP